MGIPLGSKEQSWRVCITNDTYFLILLFFLDKYEVVRYSGHEHGHVNIYSYDIYYIDYRVEVLKC